MFTNPAYPVAGHFGSFIVTDRAGVAHHFTEKGAAMRFSRQLGEADRKLAKHTAKVQQREARTTQAREQRAIQEQPLPNFANRMGALRPLIELGPRYLADVARPWVAADTAYRRGDQAEANQRLAEAEQTANRVLHL